MLRILYEPGPGEDLEEDARRLHRKMMRESNLPRMNGVTRAIIPDWCDVCGERCWGPIKGYSMCPKCRGEGRLPIGFGS